MKYCTKCGKKLEENVKFCTGCGAKISNVPSEPEQETIQESIPQKEEPVKKTGSKAVPLLVIGLVVAVLVGFLFFSQAKDKQEQEMPEDNYGTTLMHKDDESEDEIPEDEIEPEEIEPEEFEPEYILPESDQKYLKKSDLFGLTEEECRLARNEIYARHGRIFKDKTLQEYFNSFDWYVPKIQPDDFREDILNKYEVANKDLIVEYEEEQGYR
ncbi:YARHG domain-containing protein [Anaerotignum sp.]